MPQKIFGDFVESKDNHEYLIIGFSPSSIPLQQRWRNNGLSADFLADYLTTFFPAYDISSLNQQAEIKDAVAYVANELLENAMKYSYEPSKNPVSIGLTLDEQSVRFYVTNHIAPDTVDDFEAFIKRLLTEDPHELYFRQVEESADNENTPTSHLGFLTMITNYSAQLAWKFEIDETDPLDVAVTTMVKLLIQGKETETNGQ